MLHLFTKRRLYYFLLLILMVLVLTFVAIKKKRPRFFQNIAVKNELALKENEKVFGILSRENPAFFDTLQNFPHFVLKLNDDISFEASNKLSGKFSENRNILLTIEFWGNNYSNFKKRPLDEFINGSYDEKLLQLEQSLVETNKKIFVRINPEMEVPVSYAPWQNDIAYIQAFRHIYLLWKNKNNNIKFVWGPAGFMGMEEMYPGDDVVDVISITLQSEIEGLCDICPPYPNLKNEIHRKIHRLRYFDKPVLIIGTNKVKDSQMVYSHVMAEIDSIAKYRDIAYDPSLWKNSDTVAQTGKFIMGLHDPNLLLTSDPLISAEHIFVDFGQVQLGDVKKLTHEVFSRNHDVILTVEPWKDLSGIADTNVLFNIANGRYDSIIQRVFTDISDAQHTVYLRFAHEMEIPITRYAWQSKDPVTYIKAFRRFMTLAYPLPPNVKRIWGPAGDRASLDFYPGDDVVDYVSIAIYGLPDKNITDPNKQESFATIFNRKKWRFRQINKPFFITEFGVKGPEDFQTIWLEGAAKTINQNPQVIGINYFNMSDTPGAWGKIKPPDWSITPASLHKFMEILERDNQ